MTFIKEAIAYSSQSKPQSMGDRKQDVYSLIKCMNKGPLTRRKCNSRMFTVFILFVHWYKLPCVINLFAEDEPSMIRNVQTCLHVSF